MKFGRHERKKLLKNLQKDDPSMTDLQLMATRVRWWWFTFTFQARAFYREHIKCKIGRMIFKKPMKRVWKCEYDNVAYPFCPRCGEYAYITDECVFCGQRFEKEDEQHGKES